MLPFVMLGETLYNSTLSLQRSRDMTTLTETTNTKATTTHFKGLAFVPFDMTDASHMPTKDEMQVTVDAVEFFKDTLGHPTHIECSYTDYGSKHIIVPIAQKGFEITHEHNRALSLLTFIKSEELRQSLLGKGRITFWAPNEAEMCYGIFFQCT